MVVNPVREALKKVLDADAALKALATGGIFHRKATSEAVPPYVIFHKASGVPSWTFGGPPMDKEVWLVKGVGAREAAEDIDRRCKAILNRATLNIKGKAHLCLLHISDIDMDEISDGERYNHVGAEYKLDSEDE
jgi:hypothetical protein